MSFKFTDVIRQFDGSGDFSEWVRKLELVAKAQKIEELENFLPLFLAGGAFSVYENFNEKIKNDYKLLKVSQPIVNFLVENWKMVKPLMFMWLI